MASTCCALLISATIAFVFPSDPVVLHVPGAAAGRWMQLANLTTPQQYSAGVALREKIYALGGNAQSSFEEYDSKLNKWSTLPQMSTPRLFLGAAPLGQKIYAAGGISSDLYPSARRKEAFENSAYADPRQGSIL